MTTSPYRIVPLHCRPWTLNGISPRLIESHYEHVYGGAIRRLNALDADLSALDARSAKLRDMARLRQEQADLVNTTLLHELYFASLGGDGRALPEIIAGAIARDFGSDLRWRDEFIALTAALEGTSGWVLLTYVPRDRRLINHVVTAALPGIAGGAPILALDMYEHAYAMEYGHNATAYVAAFMRNIDWRAVEARYQDAIAMRPPRALEQPEFGDLPSIAPEELLAKLRSGEKLQVIDARPRHYSAKAQDMVAGAVWRDPERIDEWIETLSKDEPVVTFCVYGFHIGCQVAIALRQAGFDARYMTGGHFAWKAIKGPVQPFE